MTYKTIKSVLQDIIEGQQLAPASSVSYEEASSNEMGYTYILKPEKGEMGEESETLCDRFYDDETWNLDVAFQKSTHSDLSQIDVMHIKRENLIKAIDNPANWQNEVRTIKYDSWEIEELPNYYILRIKIKVVDRITY